MDLHDGFPVPILFPGVNLIPNILQIKTVNTALKLQRKSNVLEVWLKKLQYCEYLRKNDENIDLPLTKWTNTDSYFYIAHI